MILSITFDINGRREMGRKCLGSVLEPFLNNGLSFAILQASGNVDLQIERLQICNIGTARIFALSFRNFPDMLSITEALFASRFLSVFKTDSGETLSKDNLFSLKLNEL